MAITAGGSSASAGSLSVSEKPHSQLRILPSSLSGFSGHIPGHIPPTSRHRKVLSKPVYCYILLYYYVEFGNVMQLVDTTPQITMVINLYWMYICM